MIKRLGDLLLSLTGIILTIPIMVVCVVLIRMDSAGPILFKQKRVGRNEKHFWIYKFRTMVEDADQIGPVITAQSDPRITQVGSVLRWLKFDELPQLFNVLKGEMSVVGPRPEVPEVVKHYSSKEKIIFQVKPGIFGPNQISNRDEASLLTETEDVENFYLEKILPKKIKNDLIYVKNKNYFKDLSIIFGSLFSLISTSIKLRYIFESRRRILFLLFDLVVSIFAYWFTFFLRFEGTIPSPEYQHLIHTLPLIVFIRAPCFVYFGLYQTLWQYLGIRELFSIIRAVTVGSILIPFLPFLTQDAFPPRSVLVMDWLILIMALGASRVLFKLTAERLRMPHSGPKKNVLIIGAEDTGELLVREYIKQPSLGYRPIGFLDDDPLKQSVRIHGVKVMGKISQLSQVVKVKKADEVIIALSEASGEEIRDIIRVCRILNLRCQILPEASTLMSPQALPLKLRPINVSDLLGRELVEADLDSIQNYITGKRVLVTGAGGSIGSELARIIYQNHPEELILIDNSESSLYDIETDLQAQPLSNVIFHCYLRDITNHEEMQKIVLHHKPQVVYHAAAYKHVPLLENHFRIGIVNNILGTKTIADVSLEASVEKFVLISTDKAINPTSLMGATKRISELYIGHLAKKKKTKFMAVRFGNVFNSKGSVVPLFRKQIERGGPITITDEKVTRYFMDLSEAVFLILQASILGKGSEIFILDMGKPVRIVDLAKNLIQLMGLQPEVIPIHYTGLRPGEKMEEEIELEHEKALPTKHKKIRIWEPKNEIPSSLVKSIEELFVLAGKNTSKEDVTSKIKEIVPEYHPWQFPV